MTEGFTTYLSDIGRVAVLTPDQERDLGCKVQGGIDAGEALGTGDGLTAARRRTLQRRVKEGEAARRDLTEANLRLVVFLARRYQGRGVPFADLVQEGNVGLMSAVERFRPEKGYRFSTYAGTWIRSAMLTAITQQGGAVRIPAHLSALAAQVYRAEQEFQQEKHRAPTLAELAIRCGIEEQQIARVRELRSSPVSLEAPVGEDTSLSDLLSDGDEARPDDLVLERLHTTAVREAVEEALAAVGDERVRKLLRLRFGLVDGRTRTLAELSRTFGVTKERLRQIEARTLSRLRRGGFGNELRELMQDS